MLEGKKEDLVTVYAMEVLQAQGSGQVKGNGWVSVQSIPPTIFISTPCPHYLF